MRLFRHYQDWPAELRGAVLAIGNFDGVHLGHRTVLETARSAASQTGSAFGVMTFEPHPKQYFRPDIAPFRLTPMRAKLRLMETVGLDFALVLGFDGKLSAKDGKTFVNEVLVEGLGVSRVVVGRDFCFGAKRSGNVALLEEMAPDAGFTVTALDKMPGVNGEIIASTAIRELLQAGRMREAARLLGRPWEMEGRVEKGDQRGRTLNYPTANVPAGEYLRPAYGVYAVRAALDDSPSPEWHKGVANFGIRPMFEAPVPLLETHIFDFNQDIYGRHLRVQMVEHLRGELNFDGVDALVAQMNRDSADARAALAR